MSSVTKPTSTHKLSRRRMVAHAGVMVGAAMAGSLQTTLASAASTKAPAKRGGFRLCLNAATIRGQKLGLVQEIKIAGKAGYHGIEPWVADIEAYRKEGGSLPDLKHRIADLGLTVEGAIGFPQWIVDDATRRAQGLERAKMEMDLIAQIGGKRLAAPPSGATDLPKLDWLQAAERYRALLEAGDQIGVVPQLELWGFSKNLNRLGECAGVAIETGHPNACVLADIYHLYKGGSDFSGLNLLSRRAIQVLHLNDYPADLPREKIDDSYRVYPGDGVAPLTEVLRALLETDRQVVLSLELFNRKYWAMDALTVARAGLEKMQTAIRKAQRH